MKSDTTISSLTFDCSLGLERPLCPPELARSCPAGQQKARMSRHQAHTFGGTTFSFLVGKGSERESYPPDESESKEHLAKKEIGNKSPPAPATYDKD